MRKSPTASPFSPFMIVIGVILIALIASRGGVADWAGVATDEPTATTISQATPDPERSTTGGDLPDDTDLATVERVVDGDTIIVVLDGDSDSSRLRFIGVDAPESVHPNQPVECYGPESSAFLSGFLEPGDDVHLERDVSDTDRFDRLLRHVWIEDTDGDAVLVSELLVLEGYAVASSYPPDTAWDDTFAAAEVEAQRDNVGLWDACER